MDSLITLLLFCGLDVAILIVLPTQFLNRGSRGRVYGMYFVFLALLPYTILVVLAHPFPVLNASLHKPVLGARIVIPLFVYVYYYVLKKRTDS